MPPSALKPLSKASYTASILWGTAGELGGTRRWLVASSLCPATLMPHWRHSNSESRKESTGLNPPLFSISPRPTPKRQDKQVQSTVFTKGTKWGAWRGAAIPAVTPHSNLNPEPPLPATPRPHTTWWRAVSTKGGWECPACVRGAARLEDRLVAIQVPGRRAWAPPGPVAA